MSRSVVRLSLHISCCLLLSLAGCDSGPDSEKDSQAGHILVQNGDVTLDVYLALPQSPGPFPVVLAIPGSDNTPFRIDEPVVGAFLDSRDRGATVQQARGRPVYWLSSNSGHRTPRNGSSTTTGRATSLPLRPIWLFTRKSMQTMSAYWVQARAVG